MDEPEKKPERPYESFVMMFRYDGREVPIECRWLPEDDEKLVEAMADFLWKHRHLASPPVE